MAKRKAPSSEIEQVLIASVVALAKIHGPREGTSEQLDQFVSALQAAERAYLEMPAKEIRRNERIRRG